MQIEGHEIDEAVVERIQCRVREDATQMEVRFAEVQLAAPKSSRGEPPIQAWAVYATERAAPAGVEPLQCMLLSTTPVTDLNEAIEKLEMTSVRRMFE